MPEPAVNVWNASDPPSLAPVGALQKTRGAIRITLMLIVTLVAVGIFLIGRFLRGMLGHWVVFHFGAARLWSHLLARLAGLRIRVIGVPIKSGALVANHCSWIDILALRSVRLVYFVSKAEVANWPGVGFLTRITGTVFIERRRSHAKRQEAVLRERIAADQLLCFFPEGTSTDGLRVLGFKSSLFSAFFTDGHGAPIAIQPVTLRYRPAPGRGLPENFYGWWGDMGFEKHIWDVVTRSGGGVVEVIFHEAVDADSFTDRKQLADLCQRMVARGLQDGRTITVEQARNGQGQTA